ncbi:MAG: ABC transporter ATP-binding protein [Candidatus Methanoperedens sp.]|nr:ABC transporter ATP-binding protein [Candidatus Methanoperedens sp.]CAG0995504.1 Teichoic acids export ATP-binding protein TagH [Methanosarcinales archaeon]
MHLSICTGNVMPKDAIVVSNLGKNFKIPHERKTTLFEHIAGMFDGKKGYEEFAALKNINFTVKKGEAIGIIGENGSGKSTLLKIIAHILRPSSGSVKITGKITSFLELGVGFQPDLTARENIYLYGAVMGLSEKEIKSKLEEILEFSGLKRFEDTKLKNLSSGMQVRLAFATAIQTDPEILLMDEVLAVGDMEFQQKCLDVFSQYIREKKTILFVSHDTSSIRRFCSKSLLLRHGELVSFGDTNEIIDKYVYGIDAHENKKTEEKPVEPEVIEKRKLEPWEEDLASLTEKIAEIRGVKFIDKYGRAGDTFKSGDSLTVEITYYSLKELKEPLVGIAFFDDRSNHCYGTSNYTRPYTIKNKIGEVRISLHIKQIPFLNGRYFMQVALAEKVPGKIYDYLDFHDKTYSFKVINTSEDIGTYYVNYEWKEN